ncbi:unnamed protein product [Rhizopus microsporus]|uniref:Cyclin N-terminal domain-containing protein n=1 Tax=Rhizopus microsporus TaxID=58291 RepID=A0A1X0RNC4_RHIZD|nr:hypothetical protein BCV71DRAFT_189131 [Rhizopus microsporus]
MKSSSKKRRILPCPYTKQDSKPKCKFKYDQACNLLQAIELSGREPLSKTCLAHLAIYVSKTWEDNYCPERTQQLFYMMNSLLNTTRIETDEPFEVLLQKYCASSTSMPTLCPSVTLLVAISYIERLNKKYRNLKGTAGCGSRMIYVAYNLAAKYIHDCLRLVIYTTQKYIDRPMTPPTSPKIPQNDNNNNNNDNNNNTTVHNVTSIFQSCIENDVEKRQKVARMEKEFLCFLNFDLSVDDPIALIEWAQSYDDAPKQSTIFCLDEKYTSADEGDDEMDEDDDATL